MSGRDQKIWDRFVLLLSVETFGEKAVISEGKSQKVLFGSVAAHRGVFVEAVRQIDAESNDVAR